tara:strand:+ start:549 stop:845 length:297 start_codon:yes stop_codon:yes gene_type:complete
MPKDACYHKVKAKFKVFPSAYASGHIAKCRKVGAANYGKSKKKKDGGLLSAIKRVKDETMSARDGKAVKMTKRKSKNKNIARGCGAIMSGRRKKTKYS